MKMENWSSLRNNFILLFIIIPGCYSAGDYEKKLIVKYQSMSAEEFRGSFSREGDSPIHDAAFNGYAELVTLFLRKGISPNLPDLNGATPMLMATVGAEGCRLLLSPAPEYGDWKETMDRLLKAGANINSPVNNGSINSLEVALSFQDKRVSKYIMDRGGQSTSYTYGISLDNYKKDLAIKVIHSDLFFIVDKNAIKGPYDLRVL